MPPYDFLPTILGSVLILTTAGVILLRPISKQIAQLLAHMASQKERALEGDTAQLREMLDALDGRLQLVEERLDFTERLLSAKSSDSNTMNEDDSVG